jgi:hypothetical protein
MLKPSASSLVIPSALSPQAFNEMHDQLVSLERGV